MGEGSNNCLEKKPAKDGRTRQIESVLKQEVICTTKTGRTVIQKPQIEPVSFCTFRD